MRVAIPVLALMVAGACDLRAQCPDGSPPPCRSTATPPLDARRVAILPFRVTTADTLLGEGIAELVAMELADRSDTRPVHMGSLLSAWRGAGGGLRSPLPIDRATRVSRSLGAGRLIEGSVIGTGSRITISASLVWVADGRTVQVEPVRGHADSLENLARRLSVAVVAATGGEPNATRAYRLTQSPTALLAYFDGLSAWRQRRYRSADEAFERALDADSTFASAAFARLRSGSYNYQPTSRWAKLALRYRERLTDEERAILDALLGENYPAPRTIAQKLRDLEGLVRRYPESAEALYHLGDHLVHFGRVSGIADAKRRSLDFLERSVTLDTQSTVFAHLIVETMSAGDTARLRKQWRAHEAFFRDSSDARMGWVVATMIGDASMVKRYASRRTGYSYFMIVMAAAGLGNAAIDSMLAMSIRASPGSPATWLSYANGALIQGRPEAATRVLMLWPAGAASESILRDAFLIAAAIAADGDTAAAQSAFERLAHAQPEAIAEQARVGCARALWSAHRAQPAEWNDSLLRANGFLNCAELLGLLRAANAGALTRAQLAAVEERLRERVDVLEYAGIESIVLARLWEKVGDVERAFEAARRSHDGYPLLGGIGGAGTAMALATSARAEGRLAAQRGDTTAAVDAYRRYLKMRSSPEPRLVPQRDSVRAELTRLRR